MINQFEFLDALRNPIKLGRLYGYSHTSSGIARTVIGTAEKITKSGMISIKPITVNKFLYGKIIEIENNFPEDAKLISIRPHLLFPVSEENA